MMASVDGTSLREELDDAKARIAALRKDGKVPGEVDAVIGVLFSLPGELIAVLPERTTRRAGRNSGLPPSRTEKDETARHTGKGDSGKGAKPNLQTGDNLRKTTVEETAAVEACDACGVDPVERERRILHDIVFEVTCRRVGAEIRECPECRARTRGRFPDAMPGPGSRRRPPGLRRQPAGPVAAPGGRAGAGDLRPQALRGHLPRPCQAPA